MTAVMTEPVAASRPEPARPLRATRLGHLAAQHRAALTGITVVLAIVAATLWCVRPPDCTPTSPSSAWPTARSADAPRAAQTGSTRSAETRTGPTS